VGSAQWWKFASELPPRSLLDLPDCPKVTLKVAPEVEAPLKQFLTPSEKPLMQFPEEKP
jgi:hypothetical protein